MSETTVERVPQDDELEPLPERAPRDVPQDPQEESHEEVEFNTPIGDPATRAGQGTDDRTPDAGDYPPSPSSESLNQQLADAENRALRAYADLDNYKKRFERELARQRDIERERFLNSMLNIADNLRRALNVQNPEASPYREGLMTVMRQIDGVLRDFDVEPIPAEKGQPMDPNVHEALTTMNIPGAEHESIIEVVEPGYRMGDRVLRPAKVVVAKTDE